MDTLQTQTRLYHADESPHKSTYTSFHTGSLDPRTTTLAEATLTASAGSPTGLATPKPPHTRTLFGATFRPAPSSPALTSSSDFSGAQIYKEFSTEHREEYNAPAEKVERLMTLTATHNTFGASKTAERASENLRQRSMLRPTIN